MIPYSEDYPEEIRRLSNGAIDIAYYRRIADDRRNAALAGAIVRFCRTIIMLLRYGLSFRRILRARVSARG